jgi:nicotinate-nucleotide pyrophosphorylase (carboxylating)
MVKIEVEVKNLVEVEEALAAGADIIMLDNMEPADMKRCVALRESVDFSKSHHPKTWLEASGNVSLKNVRAIAETGVDIISIGELTHSVESADVSLDIVG